MQSFLTQLLNLPGMEVEAYYDIGHKLLLEVEAYSARCLAFRIEIG